MLVGILPQMAYDLKVPKPQNLLVKRKMLSTKEQYILIVSSTVTEYSAIDNPESATRARAPGSFI
jgi:hypothetical protein